MNEWTGEERRSNDRDHDLLTKIDANLSNFMSRFDEHKRQDDENFNRLYRGHDLLKKYLYIAMGIVSAIEFFHYLKK